MGNKRIKLPKTITFPSGIILNELEGNDSKTIYHYPLVLESGKIIHLTMDEETVMLLNEIEPKASIS